MENLLSVRKLNKYYDNFKLGPIDLDVPKGTIVGLIGENGAGKTTLLKSILGLAQTGGSIELLPGNPAGRDVRQDVGIVLGAPGFPNYFTISHIRKMMSIVYDRWDDALFDYYLRKFSLRNIDKFSTFSDGERMKLALAIAMSHGAQLLVLDEPAAGLDPYARDILCDVLFDFTRDENNGVIISSHILSDLERICDYIAFIHQGKLLFCSEKDALLERYGIYRCSAQEMLQLPKEAVCGLRRSAYGDEVLVDKQYLPELETGHTTIEDIMVLMIRGA